VACRRSWIIQSAIRTLVDRSVRTYFAFPVKVRSGRVYVLSPTTTSRGIPLPLVGHGNPHRFRPQSSKPTSQSRPYLSRTWPSLAPRDGSEGRSTTVPPSASCLNQAVSVPESAVAEEREHQSGAAEGVLARRGIRGEQRDRPHEDPVRHRIGRAVGTAEVRVCVDGDLTAEDALIEGECLP